MQHRREDPHTVACNNPHAAASSAERASRQNGSGPPIGTHHAASSPCRRAEHRTCSSTHQDVGSLAIGAWRAHAQVMDGFRSIGSAALVCAARDAAVRDAATLRLSEKPSPVTIACPSNVTTCRRRSAAGRTEYVARALRSFHVLASWRGKPAIGRYACARNDERGPV